MSGTDKATPSFLGRLRTQLTTTPAWVGASLLLGVTALGLWTWRAAGQAIPSAPAQSWRAQSTNVAVAVAVGILLATVAAVVAAALRRRVPWAFLATWVASALLLVTMGAAGAVRGWWLVVAVVLLAVPVLGGLLGAYSRGRPNRRHVVVGVVAALTVLVLAGWLVWPGPTGPVGSDRGSVGLRQGMVPPSLDRYAERGHHQVRVFRYGSTRDNGNRTVGAGVDVPTTPVDASRLLPDWPAALTSAWGFDAGALPLDATVWRPAEDGAFPLVVVVHGNATAGSSQAGFAYLGEALASRGYVVAAIDENFLNTGVLGPTPRNLDAARAWLLLEHLRQWRAWSADPSSSPLVRAADVTAVSLIGHSRGGEAVAIAADINRAGSWPGSDGRTEDYGFPLRAVVAIAPSDGVSQPAGRPLWLKDVDYLTIAGSYDADVFTFAGARQYLRTTPGRGQVKAAIALDRMNHSQFNSVWGRHDAALGLARHVLGTGVLVAPEEQRRAALGLVAGFLDLAVAKDRTAVALFDGSVGGLPFQPGVTARRQFATGGSTVLTPGEGVGDEGTPGTMASRTGPSGIPVTHLTGPGQVRQTYAVPAGSLPRGGALRVDLADAAAERVEGRAVRITVELTGRGGSQAVLPLGADGELAAPLPGQFVKAALLMPAPSSEPVLTTYTVPVEAMTAAGVEPETLTSVTLVVDAPGAEGVDVGTVAVGPGR